MLLLVVNWVHADWRVARSSVLDDRIIFKFNEVVILFGRLMLSFSLLLIAGHPSRGCGVHFVVHKSFALEEVLLSLRLLELLLLLLLERNAFLQLFN